MQNKSNITEIGIENKNEINLLENKLQKLKNENQILKYNNNRLTVLMERSKENNSGHYNKNIKNIRINEKNFKFT